MRTLALIPALIALAAATVLAQSDVYLSTRADGKDGTGAAADPRNASTQAQFDAIFAALKPNTAVHIGAGTYHTKGEALFTVQPNTKIRGAGMEATKIIQDGTGRSHACVFSGMGGGIEIEDLSIDCGFQNQRRLNGVIKCNANAIGLCGSHLAVRRCRVFNYGSPYDDECGENFAVILCQAPRFSGDAINLLAEDCVFTGMSPLSPTGCSVLTISGGPLSSAHDASD